MTSTPSRKVTASEAKAMASATNENPPELKEDERWVSPEVQRAMDGEQVEFKLGADAVEAEEATAPLQDPEAELAPEANPHPAEADDTGAKGAVAPAPEPEPSTDEPKEG